MYYKISRKAKRLMTDLTIGAMTEGEFMEVTGMGESFTVMDDKTWAMTEFSTIVTCTTGCKGFIPVYDVMATNKYRGGAIEVTCHHCRTKRSVAPIG